MGFFPIGFAEYLVFVLGCGVTIYHGIHVLLHPGKIDPGWITWVVLLIAAIIDGYVLVKALGAVRHETKAAGGFRGVLRLTPPSGLHAPTSGGDNFIRRVAGEDRLRP